MDNRNFFIGLAVLAAGLFASSISSFFEHFALFGTVTDFTRGLFNGLFAVAFAVAIFVLVRNKRTTKP